MKRLIVTADDAGSSAAVNEAAREARSRGVVTVAGFNALGAALDEAAAWAKSDPGMGAGVHLDLERFFHADPARPSQQWDYRDPRIPVPEILEEMESQVRSLVARGLFLRHLSSRHHLHLRPELFPLACDVAKKFRIPVVRFFSHYYDLYPGVNSGWLHRVWTERGLAAAPYFIQGWYWGNVDEDFSVAELACRPSMEDEAGRRDLAACVDFRLREYLRYENVQLATFDDFLASRPAPGGGPA